MGALQPGNEAISPAALSKLRWRCRRGLLENDLLLERLFARPTAVTQAECNGLYLLMELADNDLLDLFLGREEPVGGLDRPDVRRVIALVRPPARPSPLQRTSP